MNELINMIYVVSSLLYSFIGIALLFSAFWIIEKLTPQNLWKQILEKQNLALAVIAAALIIGISIIIASAIHG